MIISWMWENKHWKPFCPSFNPPVWLLGTVRSVIQKFRRFVWGVIIWPARSLRVQGKPKQSPAAVTRFLLSILLSLLTILPCFLLAAEPCLSFWQEKNYQGWRQ